MKLTDFGIARSIESDGQGGLTRTDMLVGSADYLSPEQADGRPVDARTDVYSLGIVLYECLTGELPFRGDGFVAVAMKHCSEPLPDPRSVTRPCPTGSPRSPCAPRRRTRSCASRTGRAWWPPSRRAPTAARPSSPRPRSAPAGR